MGGCPSGQRELTVNQPADAYGGSNPPPPTISAHIAQQVEHILGKNEVIGSNPIVGSPMFVYMLGVTSLTRRQESRSGKGRPQLGRLRVQRQFIRSKLAVT